MAKQKTTKSTVKFPYVHVKLTGANGNAFVVLGTVKQALQRAGVAHDEIEAFINEAMAGDYDHLLRTCMSTVTVN